MISDARYMVAEYHLNLGPRDNLVEYLQRRNPNVSGVIDKLYPPQERKLEYIQKYWKLIMTVRPVVEIYGNGMLNEKDISIDHFVP